MPIPSPRKGESQDKFISRCMGDSVMNKEFPEQKQRAAVCFSTWREKSQKKGKASTKKGGSNARRG